MAGRKSLPRTLFSPEYSPRLTVAGLRSLRSQRGFVGGELDIFDAATDVLTAHQVDVVGKAVDLVQIDPM